MARVHLVGIREPLNVTNQQAQKLEAARAEMGEEGSTKRIAIHHQTGVTHCSIKDIKIIEMEQERQSVYNDPHAAGRNEYMAWRSKELSKKPIDRSLSTAKLYFRATCGRDMTPDEEREARLAQKAFFEANPRRVKPSPEVLNNLIQGKIKEYSFTGSDKTAPVGYMSRTFGVEICVRSIAYDMELAGEMRPYPQAA